MYCPNCSQLRAAEEVRFCSRCGFPLDGVAAVLANNGALPALSGHAGPLPLSPRRKGVKQGGAMMLAGVFLVPMLGLLSAITGMQPEIILFGVMVLIAGIARMLYAALFQEKYPLARPDVMPPPRAEFQQQPAFVPAQQRAALPQQQQQPAPPPASFRRRDTAELVGPPSSVTENTTRLLDSQSDPAER